MYAADAPARPADSVAQIPVIDITPFRGDESDARTAVATELGAALERFGFVMISGHAVPPELLADMHRVSCEFFRLPLEQKLRSSSPTKSRFQGYAAPGVGDGAQISERQSFNVHKFDTLEDAYAAGYPEDAGTSIRPAMWPEQPAEFREVWRRYFDEMERLARELLAIIEVALDLPPRFFDDLVDKDHSSLVGNYYSFDIDSDLEPSPFRFKAHIDDSCMLTVLYQDDGPGSLQIHQRGDGWRDVLPVEGTYVVNIGQLLERWTNDRLPATPHRVLRPAETETESRLSIPFFFKPNHDALIAPIESLIDDGDTAHYEPVTGRAWASRSHRNDYDSPAEYQKRVERATGGQ